jgi:protoheme IX farnesyltransferase
MTAPAGDEKSGGTPLPGSARGGVGQLWRDLLLLGKPRITAMVLVATAFGYGLAPGAERSWDGFAWMMLGTFLVGAGGNALNQYIERHSDRLMRRTKARPLPSGRMSARRVLAGGTLCAAAGILILLLTANALTAAVAGVVVVTYVLFYTPLKAHSSLNTLVGAVPGALPPVLGWVAASGALAEGAWSLFLIMFVWQLPHFLASAWIYREDYASASLQMLTVIDPDGNRTRRQLVLYSALLIPVSLYPSMIGLAGPTYFVGAFLLSSAFMGVTLAMVADTGPRSAKLLLRASLVYLPALFLLMWADAA